MLEAAHIFVAQKPGCDKWYSWSAARRLCSSPVPLESRYRWIQPDHLKATFLGRPHLTPCRIPVTESSVFLALSVFAEGPLRKACKGIPWQEGLTPWGSVHWLAHCLLQPPRGEMSLRESVSWAAKMLSFHRKYKTSNGRYFLFLPWFLGSSKPNLQLKFRKSLAI